MQSPPEQALPEEQLVALQVTDDGHGQGPL